MTVETLYREIIVSMTPSLGEREAKAAARVIFEDIRGFSPTDIIVSGHRTIEDFTVERIRRIVDRINGGEPVQYAVGTARFCGHDFIVTPAVLIPRIETEWLVDRIVSDHGDRQDLRVLDCGTGSGCIAISLARALRFATVEAIDISDDAISVSKANAEALHVDIDIHRADMLDLYEHQSEPYDIIVSNPPYIACSEAGGMDTRVTGHEPSTALFVEDDDPLVFYRAIARYGRKSLKAEGRIYFEINPRFSSEMRSLLESCGYADIDIIRDYLGRYRYAVASQTEPSCNSDVR